MYSTRKYVTIFPLDFKQHYSLKTKPSVSKNGLGQPQNDLGGQILGGAYFRHSDFQSANFAQTLRMRRHTHIIFDLTSTSAYTSTRTDGAWERGGGGERHLRTGPNMIIRPSNPLYEYFILGYVYRVYILVCGES